MIYHWSLINQIKVYHLFNNITIYLKNFLLALESSAPHCRGSGSVVNNLRTCKLDSKGLNIQPQNMHNNLKGAVLIISRFCLRHPDMSYILNVQLNAQICFQIVFKLTRLLKNKPFEWFNELLRLIYLNLKKEHLIFVWVKN